jgi:lipopolysaccharide transport system permease protein
MRWPSSVGTTGATEYGLNVFAGMIVFNFFAEILSRSPSVILSQPNLVTKVRFPLLLLPLVTMGAALTSLVLGSVLLALVLMFTSGLCLSAVLLPIYAIPMLAYGVALAILLAGLGVYLRDIGQIMPAVVSLLMFLTPIFYPSSAIPESLNFAFGLNPIAWAVEIFRAILIDKRLPDLYPFLMHSVISLISVWAALRLFQRISKGFADVL